MKISDENLAKLDTPEYGEYGLLCKKSFDGERYQALALFLSQLLLCLVTASLIAVVRKSNQREILWVFGLTLLLGLVHPFCWAPLLLFLELLDGESLYKRVFERISHRSSKYARFEQLQTWFRPIEEEIESEALAILASIEIPIRARLKENAAINEDLRLKRKWQDWYQTNLETVRVNCELNCLDAKVVNENVKYILFDKPQLLKFRGLATVLADPFREFRKLSLKLDALYGRPDAGNAHLPKNLPRSRETNVPLIRTGSLPAALTESTRKYDVAKPLGLVVPVNPLVDERGKVSRTKEGTRASPQSRRSSITSPPTRVITPNEIPLSDQGGKGDPVTSQLTLENIAPNRDEDSNENFEHSRRLIKPSPGYYQRVATRNMHIGSKGELCILDYEGRRVWKEEGTEYLKNVEHVSVTQGDGLGYDIVSIENKKKIYIEVKTTTGKADANLFFTGREFAAMDEFGDMYYLYRIYEFDETSGNGKLNIYKGKQEILINYKIRPQAWVFLKR